MTHDNSNYHIPTPGEVFAGRFKIERMLGEGGMGVVVEATHLMLKRRVAIKFPVPNLVGSSAAISRFVREARHGAAIRSEHIGRVLDIAETEPGQPYIVMEFVPGLDLAEVLSKQGPLNPRPAASFIIQACEALAEAHSMGIVHRDLKPANLFLTHRADGSLLIKVFDFGISKRPQQTSDSESEQTKSLTLTRKGAILGSPEYMAPEQFVDAGTVDGRADVWGLGIVLYELLTGSTPFSGSSIPAFIRAINAGPRRVETLRPDIPSGLADVIHACLRPDREQRLANVGAVARGLEPYAFPAARRLVERIERIVQPGGAVDPAAAEELSLAKVDLKALNDPGEARDDLPAVLAGAGPASTQDSMGPPNSPEVAAAAPRMNKTIELSEDDLLQEMDAPPLSRRSRTPPRRKAAISSLPSAPSQTPEPAREGKAASYRTIAAVALVLYAATMPIIAIWIAGRPSANFFVTTVAPARNDVPAAMTTTAPSAPVADAAFDQDTKPTPPSARDGGPSAPSASATTLPTAPPASATALPADRRPPVRTGSLSTGSAAPSPTPSLQLAPRSAPTEPTAKPPPNFDLGL